MTSLPNGSWRARQTLYAVLKRLVGANWGRCVVLKGNFDPTSGKAKQARVAFIKAYAHALKLQAETKTIIVYFDETYLNTGHVSKMSWHLNGHRGLSTQAKGRRLIVLHALTKDGWVRGKRADGSVCELTDAEAQVLSVAQPTAEMIWEANKKQTQGDYHESMDTAMFLGWAEFRTFPALRQLYPGYRYIFLGDNASYHKACLDSKGNKAKSFKQMKKAELAALLVEWGVTSFECKRVSRYGAVVTKTFESKEYATNAPKGPSAEELIAQLQGVKHQHQEYFTPAFELLLRRMSLQHTNGADENFHFSLNTPPYEGYDAQPIEKAWAHSKNYVALTPEAHTKMADLKRLLREGFYGVKKTVTWQEGDFKGRLERKRDINHPGVDAGRLVAHTHANINAWIKADGVLQGTVDDLYEVPNADAKALQQLVRPSLVVDFASSPDVSEDDEEEIDLPEPEDLPIPAVSSAPAVDNDEADAEADDAEADDAAFAAFTGVGDDMDVDYADEQMWARCDSSGCNKWRLLCRALTGRQANGKFYCRNTPVARPGKDSAITCEDDCDDCSMSPCTCE